MRHVEGDVVFLFQILPVIYFSAREPHTDTSTSTSQDDLESVSSEQESAQEAEGLDNQKAEGEELDPNLSSPDPYTIGPSEIADNHNTGAECRFSENPEDPELVAAGHDNGCSSQHLMDFAMWREAALQQQAHGQAERLSEHMSILLHQMDQAIAVRNDVAPSVSPEIENVIITTNQAYKATQQAWVQCNNVPSQQAIEYSTHVISQNQGLFEYNIMVLSYMGMM